MSQVIVTDDLLKDKRQKSGIQEKRIEIESGFDQWRRSDVTKADRFQKVVGFAVYPVLFLWGLLLGLIYVVVRVFREAIGFLGRWNTPK